MLMKTIFFALLAICFLAACSPEQSDNNNNTSSSSGNDVNPPPSGSQSNLVLPSGANKDKASSLYNSWKNIYYVTVESEIASGIVDGDLIEYNFIGKSGFARIRFDYGKGSCEPEGICTVSEGIGYGMLIAYFQDDRDAFERLWAYSKKYVNSRAIMDWKIWSFLEGALNSGSATDADLDIATALYLAHRKWANQDMLNDAKAIANGIWETEIEQGNKLIIPGNQGWSGSDTYNPSYFSPVAIRIFKEIDPSHDWNSVLDANYAWLENISRNGNLTPDWADANGAPKKPFTGVANSTYNRYYLESVRVPWRLVWDYAWYGEERAKTILRRFADFVIADSNGDPSKIRQQYNYTGNSMNATYDLDKTMAQKASLCSVGLVSQDYAGWLNSCLPLINDTPIQGFNYFHHILQVMYAQMLNGTYGGKPF